MPIRRPTNLHPSDLDNAINKYLIFSIFVVYYIKNKTKGGMKMAEHLPLSVRVPIEADNPSICRKEELCIKCGQCREVCTNEIGVHGTYSFEQTEGKAICIH